MVYDCEVKIHYILSEKDEQTVQWDYEQWDLAHSSDIKLLMWEMILGFGFSLQSWHANGWMRKNMVMVF